MTLTKAVSGKSSKRNSGIHDHRHLRQLISGIRDGVILIDLDHTILWASESALAMHGVASLAELGVDIDDKLDPVLCETTAASRDVNIARSAERYPVIESQKLERLTA